MIPETIAFIEELITRYHASTNRTTQAMCLAALLFSYHHRATQFIKSVLQDPSTPIDLQFLILKLTPHMGAHIQEIVPELLNLIDPEKNSDHALMRQALRATHYAIPHMEPDQKRTALGLCLVILARPQLALLHNEAKKIIRGTPHPEE